MSQLHHFVARRDMMLRTTLGHCITFVKGEPTHVPKALHSLALEKGLMPCDPKGKELDLEAVAAAVPQEVKLLVAPETAEDRSVAILKVLKAMIERNASTDFGAGGMPKPEAVKLALGWHVDAKEVRKVWSDNRQLLLVGRKDD